MAIKKISANLLGNNAVTAASIAGGAISAADIADNSITAAKISTSTFAIDSLTVNTSDLVVDTANNRVGIGTTSPNANLEINPASGNSELKITSTDNSGNNIRLYQGTNSYLVASNNVYMSANGNTDMFNLVNGKVGIGTDNPTNKLEVVESSTGTVNLANLRTTGGGGQGLLIGVDTTSSYTYIKNNTSSTYGMTLWTNGSERLRIDSSGNFGIGSSTTYSSSLIATDIGTRDFTIYSTSSDAGNYIVLTDNSSSANISYGTEGNTHILRADTTNRFQADNDGIKVFGGAAGANGVRISGKSQGEQLARQYCARTGGLIRYVSAGSGSLNGDLDAISDGDALLIAPGSYTITRKTSGYTSEHNPFREKECGIFGDTNFPGDVTISHNADADTDIRDHPIWCARWNGLFTHPLFLGFIKYVRNPSTPYNTNYSDAIVNATYSDGSTQMICGGAQNVLFDFNGTNVAWVYDNANAVHYMRFKNCTFSNYNTWQSSYSGNLADGYVWHCVFKGSDTSGGYYNAVGYDIAGSYGSITNRTLLSKGNRHGVSLSGTGSNSGTYNVDTYAGAGHLQYDPFPTIFWDDQNWPGDY